MSISICTGVTVKLRSLLLFALILLIPAGLAHATPVGDPSVIINRTTLDSTPFTGLFQVTLVSGTANIVFENALNVDITQLTIQFQVPLPTGVNTCSSDIFAHCGVNAVSFDSHTDLLTEDFVFTGGSISPDELFTFSAVGFTNANPNVIISSTPEPGTMVLLLTGALPLIGFGRRRLSAMRSNS